MGSSSDSHQVRVMHSPAWLPQSNPRLSAQEECFCSALYKS